MKKALICMLQLHKNSGSARTAFENIRYFKKHGYEVHVASMTLDKKAVCAQEAIPHKMLPWIKSTGHWRRKWYNFQVNRLRQKLKPDITIGHGDILHQDVLTLHNSVFLASELIHGKALDAKNEMAITHGNILKSKSFNKVIANSILMKNDLVHRFAIPEEKIAVVYPALDTKTFYPQPQSKMQLRERFGFPQKIVVSLVTSGNFKKRGLDIFSEAIDSLPSHIKEQASFRVLGKETSASPLITFDPVLDDIENYYRAIDVFVLPARIEEFGRVVLEAMGCGLPVITTDKVGAGELLTEESRRFVVPSHNSSALRAALEEIIQDSDLRERLGKHNAATALNYSELNVYQEFERVFSNP